MSLFRIDEDRRLYVIEHPHGFTCLGFEVAERKRRAVLEWMGEPVEDIPAGTGFHYAAYQDAMRRGGEFNRRTGKRCNANLEPALIGLEGMRVEVTGPNDYRERFYVGKSTGWMPCHLEIKTRRSLGGGSAYIPKGGTVRVVGAR